MKIFLSWSGTLSHKVALTLRDWLPSVIQNLEPYVSSEDIDKGTRWSSDISQELEVSVYGILCVTRENLNAPWLNFEAGALSKSIEKSRVTPFLFGIKRSEVKGPILQFQSTVYEKDDIKKLVFSLNRASGTPFIDETRLETIFNVWWPQLEQSLTTLEKDINRQEDKKEGSNLEITNSDILEEILELVRNQQKILTSPETLLPIDYVRSIVRERDRDMERSTISHVAVRDLEAGWIKLADLLESYKGQSEIPISVMIERLREIEVPLRYIMRKYSSLPRRLPSLSLFDLGGNYEEGK